MGQYFTHAHFLPARWRAPAGSTWRRERSTTRGSWSTRSCLSSPPLSAACRQSPGRCSRSDPPAASAQPPKVSTWLRRPSLKKEKTQLCDFNTLHPRGLVSILLLDPIGIQTILFPDPRDLVTLLLLEPHGLVHFATQTS